MARPHFPYTDVSLSNNLQISRTSQLQSIQPRCPEADKAAILPVCKPNVAEYTEYCVRYCFLRSKGLAVEEKLEQLLGLGGIRKDVTLLVISAIALVISFFWGDAMAVDTAWIAIVLCGVPIIIEALVALIFRHDIKADMLVSIALIASVAIGEYFAAGEVATIMQLGGLLEELTTAKAREGVEKLVEMTPRTARVLDEDGSEREVAAEDVLVGQVVHVRPGESIPVDGVILSGTTSIDESIMTGESMPVDKQAGDEVTSGTINQFGAISVRATRVGEDSSIQRMARLVQSADASKAKIVRLADRWATWVVIIALVASVVCYLVTQEVMRSVTILVVFCPCALVLATPTAIVAASGNATKRGFLVKEGDALERLADVHAVVFDKTGTLTKGEPRVQVVEVTETSDLTTSELYALIGSAELRSEHPLGKAIVASAREADIVLEEPSEFSMEPGRGVLARVDGHSVIAGNPQLMNEAGIAADGWNAERIDELQHAGCTVTYVAVDGKAAGIVALSDTLREDSAAAVNALIDQGITPVLLTGDNASAANAIGERVGITEVIASCRPEDKLAYLEKTEAEGTYTAMVGDGINDAPALKRAYVGIAMGGVGSDIAVEAADIAIVGDSIAELPFLLALSQHMMRVIKANLTFSMTLNFVAIVLAILAILDPVSGALVHNCGSIFVVINSALLLNWKPKSERGR